MHTKWIKRQPFTVITMVFRLIKYELAVTRRVMRTHAYCMLHAYLMYQRQKMCRFISWYPYKSLA